MSYNFEFCCAAIFTSFCVLLAFVHRYVRLSYNFFEKQGVPGPKPSLPFGTWSGLSNKFLGAEDNLKSKLFGRVFGTFDGLTPNLLITDPALIKQVLTSPSKFQNRRVLSARNEILQNTLQSLCGEEDEKLNVLLKSSLTDEKIQKIFPRIEAVVDSLILKIVTKLNDSKKINVTEVVEEFIQEVSASAIFGIDSDNDSKREFVKYEKQLFAIKNSSSSLALFPYLYEKLAGDSWILPRRAQNFFTGLVSNYIRENSKNESSTEVQNKAKNLIELLVEVSEEEKNLLKKDKSKDDTDVEEQVMTSEVVVSKCLATLLSIVSCSKTTILACIYELSKNPQFEDLVYLEVQSNMDKSKSAYGNLRNVNYLDRVLSEVLRLFPFEFRVEKICSEDTQMNKYQIKKDVGVSIPLYALHRDEEFFPEPEKFDPDRFAKEISDKRSPETYLPFGQAGLNGSDISLQIAFLTAKLTIYKLIEQLKFSAPEDFSGEVFKKGLTGIPLFDIIEVNFEKRLEEPKVY